MRKHQLVLTLCFSLTLSACANVSAVKEHSTHPVESHQSVTDERLEGFLQGKGMGVAKIADDNGYPGPLHVLDLADELALTAEQKEQTQHIYKEMLSFAKELGAQYVAKQRQYHHLFHSKLMTDDALAQILTELSILETKISYVHLSAHLKQQAILTPMQLSLYRQLRMSPPTSHHQH